MSAPRPVVRGNPYPGLRPFLEHEEHLFFGRERQVDAMADKLRQTHFLAVVGTSGSGKSSLVNCGLRPALHRGLIADAGSAWRVAQFRPGNAPIRALAQALAARGVLYDALPSGPFSATEMVEATLRMSSLGLLDAYEQAQLGSGVNLLVVADQFEELFRYQSLAAGERRATQHFAEESTAFVNLLLAVAEQRPPGVYVVLTMRSDFLGDCAQFAGLPEAINQGQYLVPRMNRDERRRAIEGPALMHGARIAPVLLTRLVNDVGDLPDQLSLLQHALNRTWARWAAEVGEGADKGGGEIELRHYEAVGSMAQALDQHAEEAYARLGSEARQRIGEKVFKALTDCGTDARGVRRPTRLATLCELADAAADEVGAVVEVFRAPECCFLMPPAGEALAADTVIDISHESLMRVWRRLRDWAEEEARSAASLRRLAQTAALHAERTAELLRDPELQMALNWRARQRPNATWAAQYGVPFDAAMQFLEASEAARTGEQEAERRALRRRQFATLAAFIAIAGAAGYFFDSERRIHASKAELERALAQAQQDRLEAQRQTQLAQANLRRAEEKEREALQARRKAEELQLTVDALMARSAPAPVAVAAKPPPTPSPAPAVAAAPPAPSATGAAPAQAVPAPPPAPVAAAPHRLTEDELGRIMPALPAASRSAWTETLNRAMAEFDITTARRQAAFLAQIAHETGQLRYLEEVWGPTDQQARYEPPSSLATSLGNVQAGDGERYRGRGLIWITGRANYQRFGQAVGADLVANPELAATPAIAARTGAWFWKVRGLNELADREDIAAITRRISGGVNGLAERQKLYERASAVLGG